MKKTLPIFLIIAVLAAFAAFFVSADAESGMKFDDRVLIQSKAPAMPLTWEAVIRVDKNAGSGRLGGIVGNYSNNSTASMNLELRSNGAVALYWNSGSVSHRYDFTDFDVRTGEKLFVAVSVDLSTKNAVLYINGEAVQTLKTAISAVALPHGLVLGGDLREKNTQYLKSAELFSVALWSDVRTADEIKNDMEKPDTSDPGLIAAYDLTSDSFRTDLSANRNDLIYDGESDYDSSLDPDARGTYFTADDIRRSGAPLPAMPATFEAVIKLPRGYNERGGVILGNYGTGSACVNFEVSSRGCPRIYYVDNAGKVNEYVFTCDVRTGDWAHLAIVNDAKSGRLICYIDGERTQIVSKKIVSDLPASEFCIGGDLRSGNAQYFKGKIARIALFSDVRTDEEIAADAKNVDPSAADLIALYDLEGKQNATAVSDGSKNALDVTVERNWLSPDAVSSPEDYAFSLALIGDIQNITEHYPDELHHIFDWLVENAEKKKIKYVLGLGDTTNSDTKAEWQLAKSQYDRLRGIIPYSVVRGNHDSSANFNAYFGDAEYKSSYELSFNGKIENTARFVTAGSRKYLIFTLDYGPSDSVLDWAGGIADDNPDCAVIVTTHAYLFRDGTTLDQNDVYPPSATGGSNNGDAIWEKFVSKHKNVSLVVCGHDPCDNVIITQTHADAGNVVTQMLVDPQGMDKTSPTGMICMLYFSEDGATVRTEYYSTVRGAFFREVNQTEFKLDLPSASQGEADTEETTEEEQTEILPIGSDVTSEPAVTAPESGKRGGCGGFSGAVLTFLIPSAIYLLQKKQKNEKSVDSGK